MLPIVLSSAQGQTKPWPPRFIHSKIATTLGGWHATTRGTIRLVFGHEGKWYPNMNADLADGIGILYLKGSGRSQVGKPPLDIMFASTGPPKAGQPR